VDIDGRMYSPADGYSAAVDPSSVPENSITAYRWAEMDHSRRTEVALAGGEAIHPGFTDHVYSDAGLSVSWNNQPYQMGIGPLDDFKARPQSYARLIEPLDRHQRLYLAGDGLSYWGGWQEGAVRSAWWTLQKIFNHTEAQAQ
jgi:monoamine oxidase